MKRRLHANSKGGREPSASALAEAIANGDADAESVLVAKYAERLLYILQRETRDGATAEDLCQETFRVVLERLRKRRLSAPDKLASFIIGVARKLLQAHRRASTRLPLQSGLLEEIEDAQQPPLEQAVRSEEDRLLRAAIQSLTVERDRELLTRCYLADEDKDQVCESLGLERSQLNKAISRARSRLRKLLEETTLHRALPKR